MIETVLGPISEDQLGVCSPHEHIFIDMRGCVDITGNEPEIFHSPLTAENRADVISDPYAILDNALLEGVDDAIRELDYFRCFGVCSMIECTPDEIC